MVSIGAKSPQWEASRRAFDSPALHWDRQHNTARPAVCMTSPLSVRQPLWYEARSALSPDRNNPTWRSLQFGGAMCIAIMGRSAVLHTTCNGGAPTAGPVTGTSYSRGGSLPPRQKGE